MAARAPRATSPLVAVLIRLGCRYCADCHGYAWPDHRAHSTLFDLHTTETFPPTPVTLTGNAKLAAAGDYWGSRPHLPYELTNLGAAIRADRERIEHIRRRQDRSARAEASGGVVIEGEAWVRVTFADKPAREILEALRAAGFRWGAGSWVGERAKLPAGVAS